MEALNQEQKTEAPKEALSAFGKPKLYNNFLMGVRNMFLCSSTDYTRWHLNGVYLNFKKGTAVATDGHMILEQKVEYPEELRQRQGRICPPEVFKYLCSIPSKELLSLAIEISEKTIVLVQIGIRTEFEFIQCEYPDYEKCIPAPYAESFKVTVNPSLLARIKSAAGLREVEGFSLEVDLENPVSPIIIHYMGERIGALMPMRDRSKDEH